MGNYGEWRNCNKCGKRFFAQIMLPRRTDICPKCDDTDYGYKDGKYIGVGVKK